MESVATQPTLAAPDERPRLRGVFHAWAVWFAAAATVVLLLVAPDERARVAGAIYGLGLCALFAVSGTYHRWRWNPRWKPLLRRIDHSTIFVFIAASYTPVALLALNGPTGLIVLLSVWIGAAGGVAFSLAWIDAPRLLSSACYVAIGWVIVIAAPQMLHHLGLGVLLLFLGGGLLYSAGAAIYATQRPDPWPRTFGFHEVFHTLVIAAAALHFVAMVGWVIPYG